MAISEGRWDVALAHLGDAVSRLGMTPEIRLALANALFHSGRYAEAIEHLNELQATLADTKTRIPAERSRLRELLGGGQLVHACQAETLLALGDEEKANRRRLTSKRLSASTN